MPTTTYDPIASYTFAGAAASYTFNNIPASWTDLILVCTGTASTAIDLRCTFNNDTGTNYSRTYLYGNGSSSGSGKESSMSYIVLGALNNTNSGVNVIQIQNYSNSTTYKSIILRTNIDSATQSTVGLWRSTSAINRIDFGVSSGTISAGTTITLYGIL